jgi:hypothetical protein
MDDTVAQGLHIDRQLDYSYPLDKMKEFLPQFSAIKMLKYSYFCFVNLFNHNSVLFLSRFYCNINCNVGSHKKKTTDLLVLTCHYFILDS